MQFKLILALVEEKQVEPILKAAREAGTTGATVITSARGEGLVPQKSFFGLDISGARDIVLLVVEEHLSGKVLEAVAGAGRFDTEGSGGIALQLDIEDAVGLSSHIREISKKIEKEL